MTELEKQLKAKCAPLDEMLCDLKRSDAAMKEFEGKRETLGDELWSECAKLMVDGYKNQLLQAIVAIEDIKIFINKDSSKSKVKEEMLIQLNEWLPALKEEYEKNKQLRDLVRQFEKKNCN